MFDKKNAILCVDFIKQIVIGPDFLYNRFNRGDDLEKYNSID